jgi:hypothetical protein
MKKFLSAAMSAIIACASIFSCTLTAFAEDAETEDVTIDCSSAEAASNWTQSLTIEQGDFNATRLTKDSKIVVTFNSEDVNEKSGNKYSAELIFQSWENTTTSVAQDGAVWAKIAPVEFDETTATYDFESIATAYGTDDFSQVYKIMVGATDRAKITVTGVKITNCKTKTYGKRTYIYNKKGGQLTEKEEKDSKGTNPIIIVIAVIAGIAIAVVVIVIIMNKKSSEAFDVSTGKFVDKKNLFDESKNDEDEKK